MPVPFTSNDPAAVVLGSHDTLLLEAPDDSCRWNGFPISIKAGIYPGGGGIVEATSRQISAYTTPIPSGGSPSDAQWPYLYMDDPYGHVHAGDTLELDISFRSSGSGTVVVTDPYNGAIWSANFLGNGFHGYANQAAITMDCAQIGCPNGPNVLITAFAPFNPLVPTAIGNGILTVRWVGGGTPEGGVFFPCESYFAGWSPPACDDEAEKQLDGFAISGVVSPPDSDWTNEVVPGDGGIESTGTYPTPPWGVVPSGSFGSAFWNPHDFPQEQAAYAITSGPALFTGTDGMWIYLGLVVPGTAGVDGYVAKCTATDVTIYRIDNGVLTALDNFVLEHPFTSIPDGTAMGFRFFRAAGGLLGIGYTDPTGGSAVFKFIGSVNDSTYTGRGHIGLGIDASATGIVELFGGGALDADVPGFGVILPVSSCGNITLSWNALKSNIDVMNVAGTMPLIATILGTHGGDAVEPGMAALEGAVCTGTVGSTPGG